MHGVCGRSSSELGAPPALVCAEGYDLTDDIEHHQRLLRLPLPEQHVVKVNAPAKEEEVDMQ